MSTLSHRVGFSKYLSISAYLRKARLIAARTLLKWGVTLRNTTLVDGERITFVATSFIEYFLRAEESYTREEVTMYWIRNCIRPGDVVFDIGANVGAYSLLVGKKVATGSGMVYAFEPEAANFSALNRNIRENLLSETVLAYSIAFADSLRIGKFYLSDIEVGSAMHSVDQPISDRHHFVARHVQGVVISSVDMFVSESGIKFPNHIKIDVDGVEKSIVKNMSTVLHDERVKSIMIEIELVISGGEIEALIESAGFQEIMREHWEGKTIDNVLYTRTDSRSASSTI